MRRILALLTIAALATTLSSCTMWAPPKHATWKNTTSLEEMEKLYWQAIKDKDWANVQAHTASNYRHASAGGYYDRQQILDTYKKIALIDYSLGDFEVVDHADTTVVTYNALVTFELDGVRKGPTKYRNMTVWQQQKNGWQMIAGAAFPSQ